MRYLSTRLEINPLKENKITANVNTYKSNLASN